MESYRTIFKQTSFHLATLSIVVGLLLTLISWLKLCSETCSDAHNYRFFGLPFEFLGGVFLVALLICHLLSKYSQFFYYIVVLMVAGGLGAESMFIWLQKYEIGHWCPVCLGIASTLLFTGIFYLLGYLYNRPAEHNHINQGVPMKNRLQGLGMFAAFVLGFLAAFGGVTKIDRLEAAESAIKEKIKFGNSSSPVEVFVFTDWACPACRMLEPKLENLSNKIMKKASLTFVDVVVHPETLNYAPYNLSFMIQNKPEYFKARGALTRLSQQTKKPNDRQISQIMKPLGVNFQELGYEDISLGMKYFDQLADKFKINATPTMVIINRGAKKGKKLSGVEEITESNVLKAIDSLKG